jgi:hypothetical protein
MKRITIIHLFISLFIFSSCTVEHDEQNLVVRLIENPNDLRDILSTSASGKYYLDSIDSKHDNLQVWASEFKKIKEDYSIKSFGYFFRKEKYFLFFDERDSIYSKIVIESPKESNDLEFVFEKDRSQWKLSAIGYSVE